MSERLPYEDHLQQHWNDLPLPDENKAWEDMRRRLEEEDDDRPIIAWWRRGCLLWGLLLLVIFGSGIWLIKERYFSSGTDKKTTIIQKDEGSDKKRKDTVSIQTIPSNTGSDPSQERTANETGPIKEITGRQNKKPGNNPPLDRDPGRDGLVSQTDKQNKKDPGKKRTEIKNPLVTGKRRARTNEVIVKQHTISNPVVTLRRNVKGPVRKQPVPTQPGKKPAKPVISSSSRVENQIVEDIPGKTTNPPLNGRPDSFITRQTTDPIVTKPSGKKDSVTIRPPIARDSLATNTAKKDSAKKKQPVSFSAGIAMQQLLPVAGQKTVPYNSLGRKGTLADYIPSVYFRVNKGEKWFVQGEFRYGAPQYTKEFVYKQQRRDDTAGSLTTTTRTTNTLKKTYYHQLPVTFNYFVTKNWFIGAGLSWNKFVSALADNEVTRRNNSTSSDSLISKGIVRDIDDSAGVFAKHFFQGIMESQYKWKRFSFGARYAFGLQPYIKFTLQNGETGQDRSSSLQVFLRYDIWRSKKKE